MPLITSGLMPIHWAVAGALLAAITMALLFVGNRRLGLSSGFEDACSLVLDAPYFLRDEVLSGRVWRFPFLGGLVIGGALSAMLAGGWSPTWALGRFDEAIGLGPAGKVVWMFAGGMLIGFGTRLAGGCTSGHGIFGLANLEVSSLLTAASYMAGGVLATQLIYRFIFTG